jgi:hypothetical protein
MLKGTDFPHKESRPPKRPPKWEGATLPDKGRGMLRFRVDLARARGEFRAPGRRESLSCALYRPAALVRLIVKRSRLRW